MSTQVPYWERYKVSVPEGESGDWKVDKMVISEEEADHENSMSSFSFSSRQTRLTPGTYTRLTRGGTTVMTDTRDEIRDHLGVIHQVEKGDPGQRVLIAGLGIGMVAEACLKSGNVAKMTIIELSPDVIELTGKGLQETYGSDVVEVIQADIFEWKPPKGNNLYDVVWIDIWDNKCGDNCAEMTKLKRRYARKAEWKGFWGEDECRYLRASWQRQARQMGLRG